MKVSYPFEEIIIDILDRMAVFALFLSLKSEVDGQN